MSQPKSSQSNQLNPAASEVLQEARNVNWDIGRAIYIVRSQVNFRRRRNLTADFRMHGRATW